MPNDEDKNDDTKQEDSKQDEKKQEETKQEDTTYDLKVNGEVRRVTLDEMKDLASKSAGAEAKFRDAAEIKKTAEKGLRISKLVESLSNNPTEADTKELAVLLGVDPGELMNDLREITNEEGDDKDHGKATRQQGISKEMLAAALMEMGLNPEEIRNNSEYIQLERIERAKKEIRSVTDTAVDKDGILAKMIVGDNEDVRRSIFKDRVAEDVLRKIQDGVPYGADMVAASIQKIRSEYTKFGIPGKLDQYPIVLGLGPGGGLPAEVQTDEPIKRISSAEDDDEKNLIARYLQKTIQAVRKSKGA